MPESIKAKRLSRREFMKAGTVIAGAAALAPAMASSAAAAASPPRPRNVPRNRTLSLVWFGSREGRWVDYELWNPYAVGANHQNGPNLLYEPLAYYSAFADKEYMWLAESYKYSADFKELTIKTRAGIKWSDGQPFSAEDVAYTLTSLRDLGPKVRWGVDVQQFMQEAKATDRNTVVNAFYLRGLRLMAELARAIGRQIDAVEFTDLGATARAAFQAAFFDAGLGLYRDGVNTGHTSLHANLFPLAFGLVPESHRAQIAVWLAARGMKCSPYAAQYLLEGLFQSGGGCEAISLMTAPGDRSWRHMVESGATITWEAWDQRYWPAERQTTRKSAIIAAKHRAAATLLEVDTPARPFVTSATEAPDRPSPTIERKNTGNVDLHYRRLYQLRSV